MKRRRRARIGFALRDHDALYDDRDRGLAGRLALAYLAMAALGGGLAVRFVDGGPWWVPSPWIDLPPVAAASASAAVGVGFAFAVAVASRRVVRRPGPARELADALSPIASRLGDGGIVVVAVLSSVGEELLFRALLVPLVGIVAASALFGIVHQVRGPARWTWVGWATAVGVVLSILLQAFGSLLGPIVAHALINAANLSLLRALAAARPRSSIAIDAESRPPESER